MAFDETYNEPESTEVLVKSLDPEHPAQLHYAHAGDACLLYTSPSPRDRG